MLEEHARPLRPEQQQAILSQNVADLYRIDLSLFGRD